MIMAKLLVRETMVNYLATIILPKTLNSGGRFSSVGNIKLSEFFSIFGCLSQPKCQIPPDFFAKFLALSIG
jgi:hypothetical protein